jgi:hypothetical protein
MAKMEKSVMIPPVVFMKGRYAGPCKYCMAPSAYVTVDANVPYHILAVPLGHVLDPLAVLPSC